MQEILKWSNLFCLLLLIVISFKYYKIRKIIWLQQTELSIVLNLNKQMIWEYDVSQKTLTSFLNANQTIKIEELLLIIWKEDQSRFLNILTKEKTTETIRIKQKDNFEYYEVLSVVFDNKRIIISKNINLETKAINLLKAAALQDPLTSLYNRKAIEDLINQELSESDFGVFFLIDIDNFKSVNDQHGHLYGDELINGVVKIICKSFRDSDVIGRIGGDEFVIFVKNWGNTKEVHQKGNRLAKVLRVKQRLDISCSIGISMYPQHGNNYNELMEHADQAMYAAKKACKGTYQIYHN
ncbi:MAG: GGDEF domain-containing protein [Anaerorhabdus sp.]|uniref:GGDEF domain-containing protein n=1 Tax=Anaerorhabdus sp. TaxID=1872524 RepID=UPI002FC64AFE